MMRGAGAKSCLGAPDASSWSWWPSARSVGSGSELLARLHYLGESGSCVGVNEEESRPGEFAVVCPIRSTGGAVVAAFSQSAHGSEMTWDDFIGRVFAALTGEAACISSLLGYECGGWVNGLEICVESS